MNWENDCFQQLGPGETRDIGDCLARSELSRQRKKGSLLVDFIASRVPEIVHQELLGSFVDGSYSTASTFVIFLRNIQRRTISFAYSQGQLRYHFKDHETNDWEFNRSQAAFPLAFIGPGITPRLETEDHLTIEKLNLCKPIGAHAGKSALA